MKKILLAEVIVLLALVVIAVFIRVGDSRKPDAALSSTGGTQQTTAPTDDAQQVIAPTGQSQPTDTLPSEAGATEVFDPETQPPTEAPTEEPTLPTVPEGPGIPAPDGVVLTAKRYFVYDVEREEFLAISGSEDAWVYPASITKLFSAFVALQYLDPETVVTAGDELDLVAEDSSIAFIQKGNQLTVDMLVEGMLLPSGNDASYILAAAAARAASGNANMAPADAIAYFVDLMNATAKTMGMTGSNFRNPDGYHVYDHYTSCHDLTIIARLALSNEVISRYASTYKDSRVVYESGEINSWKNTNALINPDSGYYCHNAIGLKTGSTKAAGNCLLSAFREKDGVYIIGVFGCEESDDRFRDTRKLYWTVVCE